jgi:hypothetical protein
MPQSSVKMVYEAYGGNFLFSFQEQGLHELIQEVMQPEPGVKVKRFMESVGWSYHKECLGVGMRMPRLALWPALDDQILPDIATCLFLKFVTFLCD